MWSRVELNHCLWIFSPPYNNHLYDSSINFHIVKDLYHCADEGSRTHTPSLIPGSEPSVATITPHPHFIGYYILFTPSMHCFNLIEPISSPCLILQQESLSGSVSPYMKCWLDFPSTPLYWERDSNPCHMLERHIAWTASRLSQHLFSTAKITKIFETYKSFCIFLTKFNQFTFIHRTTNPSHQDDCLFIHRHECCTLSTVYLV